MSDSCAAWRKKCVYHVGVLPEFSETRNIFGPIQGASKPMPPAEHLAAIVSSTDDAVVSKDLDGVIIGWNPGAERLFGYTAAEMIGQSIYLIVPEELTSEEDMILWRIRRGERIEQYPTRRRRKDGSLVDVSISISPVRDPEGTIVGASKVGRDITEQLRADAINSRLAAIVESSDDAIIAKNLDGIVESWNGGAERLFGYMAEEMIGRPITIILPPDRIEEEARILARLRNGERVDHFETVRLRKDGSEVQVSVTISPIRDRTGKIVGASKVARDISERKLFEATSAAFTRELEQRVKERTSELEAAHREMESFTYSVAHDLRSPLRAIIATSRILEDEYGEILPEDARTMLARQASSAVQLANIIDALLTYSRLGKGALNVGEVDLSEVAEEVVAQLAIGAEHRVEIQPDLAVRADPHLMHLLMQNLLDNARKFSPGGGVITVGRSYKSYFVRDTGVGFDMAYAEKVFMPFERLAPSQAIAGTGIGLASVKRIVERHGGTVWASSAPGEGTTIYFTLP